MIKTINLEDVIEVFIPQHNCYRQVVVKSFPMNPGEPWIFLDVQDSVTYTVHVQGGVFIKQQNG